MLERINELERQIKSISKEIAEIKEKAKVVTLGTLMPGETFMLGNKEFIVLEHEGEGTKIISKNLWGKSRKFGDSKNYITSSLKDYHEKDVYQEIAAVVGDENIIEYEVDLTALDGGNDFGTIKCKVSPIPFMEARKYFHLLVNEDLPDWWWTLTSWNSSKRGYTKSVTVVSPSGGIIDGSFGNGHGVRPFGILRSSIFVSKC